MKKLLTFTSICEVIIGIFLMLFAPIGIQLIFGVEPDEITNVIVRIFGIAIICLGLACFPLKNMSGKFIQLPSVRGMLGYNLFAGIFFAYLKFATDFNGILLLPAAVIHILFAIIFIVLILNQKNIQ